MLLLLLVAEIVVIGLRRGVAVHFLLNGQDLFAAASAFGPRHGRVQEVEEVGVVFWAESVEEFFYCSVSLRLLS